MVICRQQFFFYNQPTVHDETLSRHYFFMKMLSTFYVEYIQVHFRLRILYFINGSKHYEL